VFHSQEPAIPEGIIRGHTLPLGAHMMQGFEDLGDKPALINGCTEEQRTYADILVDVDSVASALFADGFRKGDVIAAYMVSPNCYNSTKSLTSVYHFLCTWAQPQAK
jgi:acyl-coenzyme A synthetase/AMP-(fatty) acid ligase